MSTPATSPMRDDAVTICAISIVAFVVADMLHEAVGHGFIALLTGAQSGVVSSVAWSSTFDSRLVSAGGTLVNLAAGVIFWFAMRAARNANMPTRVFLLLSCAFNLFDGTGYFFFSGVTDFGDWAAVIAGIHPHWLWRTLIAVSGLAAYFAVALGIGRAVVRYLDIPASDQKRMRQLMFVSYFSAIAISVAAGLRNPIGMQLLWQSALPATAGANSGLLWLQYYIPRRLTPERPPQPLNRSYAWISVAAACAAVFIFVVGPGITLHR